MDRKILILVLFALCSLQNGYSQSKAVEDTNIFQPHWGVDIGLGVNSFSGEHDNYFKAAVDFGVIYELKEKFLMGLDLSFSPKEKHEDTGVDGSRSSHEKWDGQAICTEAYIGYSLFNRTSLLGGVGVCFSSEYEVMKGYSNLSSYKRGSKTLVSPIVGIIYEFPLAHFDSWYLKYDMAIGGYDRFSLSAGLKF
ncbi:MAG: hypothetical protein A2X09_15570 [Bacteroidetes bacterium GWF2_43_11]|nr:MAG: hypothetical protein A2X09_15570 [Bacteroidetes bacterium GWF2_43_11]